MGQKDLAEKSLLQLPEVFADVINVLIGEGKTLIREDQLLEAETELQYYDPDKSKNRVRIPDVSRWIVAKNSKLRVNIQNETGVDGMILLRIAGHDGGHYSSLYHRKAERIPGVLTIVLYYGFEQRWSGKRSIKEIIAAPDWSKEYIDDGILKIYEIAYLDRRVIDRFQSDFWFLADYLWQARHKKSDDKNSKYEIPDRNMRYPHYVLQLLCAFEGNNELYENYQRKGKEEIKMSGIISRWGEEAEARGIALGEARGEARGIALGEARGEVKGRKMAEERNNRLFRCLMRDKRYTDAMEMTENPEKKKELYKEYNIV